MMNVYQKYITALLFISLMVIPSATDAQIFSTKTDKQNADQLMKELKSGTLVVPLMKHSRKISTLKELAEDPSADPKSRRKMQVLLEEEKKKLSLFNIALIEHFTKSFDYCSVLFIENDQLNQFDPNLAIFINPGTMESDSSIKLENAPHFFLRYHKSTGIATAPEEVRSFVISDRFFQILDRPFPMSPDRQTSFKLRFRDLLNLSLNTNELIEILVTKLNESLYRY